MKIATLVTNTEKGWEEENPILPLGYLAFETDTNRFKYGDGVHKYNDLAYTILPSVGVRATGTVLFYSNPADGQTKDFNGTTLTFKDSPGAFPEVQRESSLNKTLANAVAALSAQTGALAIATYEQIAEDKIKVTAVAAGVKGNTYTLSGGTASFLAPATLENGVEKSHTPNVRLVASGTSDTISGADNGGVIYYANDDPLDVSFANDIGGGFECWVIRNVNADLVNFDSGVCQSASGYYTAKAGGTVRIINPDAAVNHLSGDLVAESLLFADVPGDPKLGDRAMITDSDTTTPGTSVGGGGTDKALIWFDGGTWRVLAAYS